MNVATSAEDKMDVSAVESAAQTELLFDRVSFRPGKITLPVRGLSRDPLATAWMKAFLIPAGVRAWPSPAESCIWPTTFEA
jgi:hypothetical protein